VAHIVNAKMTIAGISGIEDFFSININETVQGHHSFSVNLPLHIIEGDNQTMQKSHELIGKNFLVELTDQQKLKYKFEGIITTINFSKSAPHQMALQISGMSPTILLDDHEVAKSFSEKDLKGIFNDVINNYSVKSICKVNPMFTEKLDYCVQYRETTYNFIRRLVSEYGEWFYFNGEKIVIGKLDSADTVKIKLGDGLHNYGYNLNAIPLKDNGSTYNYVKDEIYYSESQHDTIKNLDPFSQKVFKSSEEIFNQEGNDVYEPKFQTKKSLEAKQALFKSGLVAGLQTLTGNSSNHNLHVGTTIDITGTEMIKTGSISKAVEFNIGKYVITGISHSIGREGNYNNNFSAIPHSLINPPFDSRYIKPKASKQIAEVVDNKDSDNIGRIQVRFPWMTSEEKTPWIRIMMPHAHSERGIYFIPEIGDSVIVDFENGDPDCPIVMGSLYHGNAKPAKWYNENNDLKAIMTKSGNELLFNDESGNETIQIFNKDQENMITLTLEGSKKIRIESTGYIEIQADKDISLKADNIEMTANKKISLNCNDLEGAIGNNTKIDTGSNYELSAGMNAKINAGTNCEVSSGMDTKIEAGANLKCSGTMGAEVKGLNTKIDGSAMLELKAGAMAKLTGAMVKIN